jgi:hypothetical protein
MKLGWISVRDVKERREGDRSMKGINAKTKGVQEYTYEKNYYPLISTGV